MFREMRFLPDYPLMTPRLRLRPFSRGDVDAVYDYRRREDVARFLFDEAFTRVECAEAVQHRIGQVGFATEGDKIVLAAECKEHGDVIGEVSLIWRSASEMQGEIGYIFHPKVHGQGLATEAAARMLKLGFEGFNLHRIMARCDARNLASARVMERIGMRREAHFQQHRMVKGRWDEEFLYAILRAEWEQKIVAGD